MTVEPFIREVTGVWAGEPVPARGEPWEILDPSTGGTLTTLRGAAGPDLDAVLDLAVAAQQRSWRTDDPRRRARYLLDLAGALDANAEEFATIESRNAGKPIARARGEVAFAAATLRYFAGTPQRVHGQTNPAAPGVFSYTDRVPAGVCAAIVPNNYPLLMGVWKLAAALAYGNAIVVKPAEETPLSLLRMAAAAAESGLPPGLLSIVTGGPEVGQALCRDSRVAAVSLTGSVPAGREVAAACGRYLKPVALELGGKSPVVVFPDADLESATAAIVDAAMGNTGQACVAGSRVLAAGQVYDELVERVVAAVARLRVGHPLDEGTDLGPMVSAAARERACRYVTLGSDEGARAAPIPASLPAGGGFYVAPAVFTGVRPDMAIAREEIFGPVLAMLRFDTEDEALRMALHSDFALAASVWTSDVRRAHRMAAALRTGMVWVNTYGDTDESVSVGGLAGSGYGRELGIHAQEQYSQTRSVWIRHG